MSTEDIDTVDAQLIMFSPKVKYKIFGRKSTKTPKNKKGKGLALKALRKRGVRGIMSIQKKILYKKVDESIEKELQKRSDEVWKKNH